MKAGARQAEIEKALPTVIDRLTAEFHPVAIYQFGSSLTGGAGHDGDLDILVVLAGSDEDFFQRGARASKALRGIDIPIDVLVYSRHEFEARAAIPISFERSIRQEGRMVYAA